MKRIFTILVAVLLTANLFLPQQTAAQSPEKMSYQTVIRNSSDQLVTNQNVGMQISILQGSANGTAIYVERHFPTTNANGLATVEIGNGTVVSGNFTTIDWANGSYFIKTETDLNGGASYTITGTSQLLSVPYALHAKTAANTFSGNYNDLKDAPIYVSTFKNDAGYLIFFTETDPVFNAWDKSTGISITESQITDLDHFTNTDETEPCYF